MYNDTHNVTEAYMSKLLNSFRKGKQNVLDAYGSLKMVFNPNERKEVLNNMLKFIEQEILNTDNNERLFFYYGYRYQTRKLLSDLNKSE